MGGGHTSGRTTSGAGRDRDPTSDHTPESLHRRPEPQGYLATHKSRGISQRHGSTYDHAESEERTPPPPRTRSLHISPFPASTVATSSGQHRQNKAQQTPPPDQARGASKPKMPCHSWGNNGMCKFGPSCRYRHDVAPSMETNQAHRPSRSEAKEKDQEPAFSPRQQQPQHQQQHHHQQHQQREKTTDNWVEKQSGRYHGNDEEQDDRRGRRRGSWDEALASLDGDYDIINKRSPSRGSSFGGRCSTCSFYEDRHMERVRDRRRGSPSPDAYERVYERALAAEEKRQKRADEARAARLKAAREEKDRADEERRASLPSSTNNQNQEFRPRPSRGPESHSQDKDSGNRGQNHRYTPRTFHQTPWHHAPQPSNSGQQQPRRYTSSPNPNPLKSEVPTTSPITENRGDIPIPRQDSQLFIRGRNGPRSAGGVHHHQTQQRQYQRRNSHFHQSRGRNSHAHVNHRPAAAGAQRRISYTPDTFDDEIAAAAAAEEEDWEREQARAKKGKEELIDF